MTIDELLHAAVAHHRAGRAAEACALYRRVLALRPEDANALHLLGLAEGNGAGGEAAVLRLLGRAVAAAPLLAPAQANLARRRLAAGDAGGGLRAALRAVLAQPGEGEGWRLLGRALLAAGPDRAEAAAAAFRRLLRLRPGDADGRVEFGNALRTAGRDAGAAEAYRAALAADPAAAEAHANLGILLRDAGDGDAAVARHRRALALRPDDRRFLLNFGIALRDLGRPADALVPLDRAQRLAPDDAEIAFNRSHALLIMGDFERGLPAYEARLVRYGAPSFPCPAWDGGPLDGRSILLHTEQGLGDTLQFVRYAPLVAARGGRVVLEAERPLLRLLATLPGVERLVAKGEEAPPPTDTHLALPSLPHAFRTTLATIPAAVPYLRADPELAAAWARRLGPRDADGLRVGLVWAGNPAFVADRFRSPRLAALGPLLAVPGVRFVALQKGDGRRDLEGAVLPPGFTDLGPALGDLADTAAVMANLDLVVSSCTAPAHLAGALGMPVWVLQPFAPDWRWLLERGDSPWYPTLRLYRQPSWGAWEPAVARLAADLARLAAGAPRSQPNALRPQKLSQ